MPYLAADLGGTKLALGLFSDDLDLLWKEKILLEKRQGQEVGNLITERLSGIIADLESRNEGVQAMGISVPGIYHEARKTVWAPNIPGWENYPLPEEIKQISKNIPFAVQSDRACYITAEVAMGKAKDCTDAVFIAVGTGIGAGIISGGKILQGADGIAGAIGWMALEKPYNLKFAPCGCFESSASGDGIARLALEKIKEDQNYAGALKPISQDRLAAHHIFDAFNQHDRIAVAVVQHCVEAWGMALANVVSLLNPQMVIFGGGVFGPAARWLPDIVDEAAKWAQPVSMKRVAVTVSSLGSDAGLIGAACVAKQKTKPISSI